VIVLFISAKETLAMPLVHDTAHAFMPYPEVDVPRASTGPLSGLTFGVKDLFDVAGYPTSGGQPFLLAMSGIKTRHAETVERLLQAGASFVGKTVTDELAFSVNGQNAHFGSPINGAAPDRISGGSSSGSASAVSNGLCDFALGTDTGGSVRAPANHCGLIGLRPTHGRVSLRGALDMAPSLDTCGWFARDIDTFDRVGEVLLGEDAQPLPSQVRLLRSPQLDDLLLSPAKPAVLAAMEQVVNRLGAAHVLPADAFDIESMYWSVRHIQGHETWGVNRALITRYAPPLGPGVAERFAWSSQVTDAQMEEGRALRAQLRQRWLAVLGQDGVLVMPTMPDIAPLCSQSEGELDDFRQRAVRLLCLAGLTGCPQISLPLASREGAPLGVSLMAAPGNDRSLIRLARCVMKG
jgi:amidase